MKNLTIQKLLEITAGKLLNNNYLNKPIDNFSIDTRTIKKNECFIAIKGERFDGHKFIKMAVKQGAAAVITENDTNISYNLDIPVIKVENTIKTLEKIATYFRDQYPVIRIGITGSIGKTTAKELTFQLLGQYHNTLKTPKSFNNNIGIPLTCFQLKPEHKIAIFEMGTNDFGEIEHLSKLIRPKFGVITCIASSHLEKFKDLQGVQKAKQEILAGMDNNSTLFINTDDPACVEIGRLFNGKTVTFGCKNRADIQAKNIHSNNKQIFFTIRGIKLNTPIQGKHNIYNVLVAIAISLELNIPLEEIKETLKILNLPSMRLETKEKNGITIINDAYNSNLKSALAAVEYLETFENTRKIAILGGMLELGEKSEELHYTLGKEAAKKNIDMLFVIGDVSRPIFQGAKDNGMSMEKLIYGCDLNQGIKKLFNILKKGDTILLKGSRKFELEKIEKKLMKNEF